MPPEGYFENEEKRIFYFWSFSPEDLEKEDLTIKEQVKIANKKRIKAVKKENYLEAAKYRDIIKNLKR
jgi:protein-arginine kinase activator protein McsA